VATCDEDQRFVYKKSDNWIILQFRLAVIPGFDCEKNDIIFGFQMITNASRFNREPFKLTNPIILNCGKSKLADPASGSSSVRSSISSAQSTTSNAQSVQSQAARAQQLTAEQIKLREQQRAQLLKEQ
jgi:hypothetical protein